MKPREPRHKVLVRARMKAGAGWHETCILNISSRGMLLQAADPPVRGSYLEIRRGPQVIVARVMWAKTHRFGVKTQDVLSIDAIVANTAAPPARGDVGGGERRLAKRLQLAAHERSRWQGRVMEYGFAAALAAAASVFAAGQVYSLLATPATVVTAALSGGNQPR